MDVAAAVKRELDSDLPAREMLSRGAVNLRALARWMIQENGWPASEEAVVAALRRYPARESASTLGPAREMMRHIRIDTRSRMSALTVRADAHASATLAEHLRALDVASGQRIRVISGEHGFKVIVEGDRVDALVDALGASRVVESKHHMTELVLQAPARARQMPGILALVTSALALRGISIEDIADGVRQTNIYVAEKNAVAAYDVLAALTRPG